MHEPAAPIARAEIAETHISVVTFIGDRAYKLKKPVRTEYLDFSTARSAGPSASGRSS